MLPAYKIEYEVTNYKKKSFLDKLKEILKNQYVIQKLLGAALILLSIASFLMSKNEDATGTLIILILGIARLSL